MQKALRKLLPFLDCPAHLFLSFPAPTTVLCIPCSVFQHHTHLKVVRTLNEQRSGLCPKENSRLKHQRAWSLKNHPTSPHTHDCSPWTWKVEARDLGVEGCPWVYGKFKASTGYMNHSLKTINDKDTFVKFRNLWSLNRGWPRGSMAFLMIWVFCLQRVCFILRLVFLTESPWF